MDILRVLLIEDSPGEAQLLRDALAEAEEPFNVEHADVLADALKLLEAGRFDAILLDLSLPDSAGLHTLERTLEAASDIPIVILTGLDDEAMATEAIRKGAQDYLIKGEPDSRLLTRAIRYAIARKQMEAEREHLLAGMMVAREKQMDAERRQAHSRQGLDLLLSASLRVLAEHTLDGILAKVVEIARQLTGARLGTSGYGFVEGRYASGSAPRPPEFLVCSPAQSPLPRESLFPEVQRMDSMRLTDQQLREHPEWSSTGSRGLLVARLVDAAGTSQGLIVVGDKDQGDFSEEDESLLRQLAAITSLALQHIEARREAERKAEEARRAEKSLRESDRRKDEFLAMLAHELRNPLAPISNSLQLIAMCGQNDEIVYRARDIAQRQMNHMVRLVDDLLDVSRINRGKINLRKELTDLHKIVTDAIETSRPLIDGARHTLTVSVPPEPFPIEADLTRMVQVIANLLNNAAKYTEPGGRIDLIAERLGGELLISVKDNGIGLPSDQIPYVFDIFAQAHGSLDRSQGGLGIGLALVKGLVELHGGSVEASSPGEGKGSEFRVRLPLTTTDVQPAETPEVETGVFSRSAPRVLVVDDSRDAADTLASLLEMLGCEVCTAYSGSGALKRAAEYRPDLVVLDIGMPDIDGYEVAALLRNREETRESILVALTGWGQPEDCRRSHEAGFDHHLVKPVEIETLCSLLASLHPRK